MKRYNSSTCPLIGVGLRHPHYDDALASAASVDFVEVHAENFFAAGGVSAAILNEIRQAYNVSLHSTALGLGSAEGVPRFISDKLKALIDTLDPILVSDHACYTWGTWQSKPVHMGDLLPLSMNKASLRVLADNVDEVQQRLGRKILIENLSSYLTFTSDDMPEAEFLAGLTELAGCGLLVDLNNILVSAHNLGAKDKLAFAKDWLDTVPRDRIGEIHLAGYTQVQEGQLIVDDHSQPVSEDCWQLYEMAIQRFGAVPTLVEWDNALPSWQTLLNEAEKARCIASQIIEGKSL